MRKLLSLSLVALAGFFMVSCDEDATPQTDFEYQIDGKTVTFTNTTQGEVTEYLWQFGDGATSSDQDPVHEYSEGGDYLVTLLARNEKGAKEESKTITIEGGGDNAVTLPTIPGADAALVAVNNKTFSDQAGISIEVEIGAAVAVFFDASNNYVDVGNVSINDNGLDKSNANYYSYYSTGESFSNPVTWKVDGAGEFEAINQEVNLPFPTMGQITSGDVKLGADYELTFKSAISDADSVVIVIGGGNGSYQTVVANNNTNTYTISSADLQNIGTGSGLISVSAYNYVIETFGDKKIGFAHQGNVSKTIQVAQ